MEKKCLLQYLREEAGNDQAMAVRIVKILSKNGIYTIDLLMAKKPEELLAIKGIGNKAMVLIGRVMTKEEAERKSKMDVYRKNCGSCPPVTLADWLQKTGCSYMECCTISRILRQNGIKTVDEFMKTKQEQFASYKGIAEKRINVIMKTQAIIRKKRS